jgi:hypothetical protein
MLWCAVPESMVSLSGGVKEVGDSPTEHRKRLLVSRKAVFAICVLIVAPLTIGIVVNTLVQQAKFKQMQQERLETWIANTKSSLEHGETTVGFYDCDNIDVLLDAIQDMPQLEEIIFEQTSGLSDEVLSRLSTLPNLERLDFRGEHALTDKNLLLLANCPKLEWLGLKYTKVTDAGLETVSGFTSLKHLSYSHHFSGEALDAVKAARPDIELEASEWEH